MRLPITLLTFCLIAVSLPTFAAPPEKSMPPDDGNGTSRFRRVYIPDGMSNWPSGQTKYLPMEGAEFERLLGLSQRNSPDMPERDGAGLVVSYYEARLKGDALLLGSGTLVVSQSAASATLVPLGVCNLAIGKPKWISAEGKPATRGLVAEVGVAADGKLHLLADRSGQLTLPWSLIGRHDAANSVVFEIVFPPCPVHRLSLELPAEWKPSVDIGIIVRDATDAGTAATDAGARRWQIEMGGQSRIRLQLTRVEPQSQAANLILASQSSSYDFSPHGLEVITELSVPAHDVSLQRVVLSMDSPLEPIEVSCGGKSLAWDVVAKGDGKSSCLEVELPKLLGKGSLKLRVRAIAPLVAGPSWKLPRILPDNLVRQSHAMKLRLPLPFCIDQITPNGCRQTDAAPLPAPESGEQLTFEAFKPDAGLELSLVQRPTKVKAVSVTSTVLGQGKMSSRVATEFQAMAGSDFTLNADVSPNWIIDTVESQPADALDDWTLEARGKGHRLSVRLARSLTAARPVRLVIVARRLFAFPGRNLALGDIVPLRFISLAESVRLIDLRTTGAYELRLTNDERLQRITPKQLGAAEIDLLGESPDELLFRDDRDATNLLVSMESRKPSYLATVRGEATVTDKVLQESYAFVCTPSKSARIDRVLVHFTQRRDVPFRWSVAGLDESRFTATPWMEHQDSDGGQSTEEESWEIAFRSPRNSPIEIRASRAMNFSGDVPVSLASLPDAARQEGTLVIRSVGTQPVAIKNCRLKLLATEPVARGQYQTIRATYQYDPLGESAAQDEPALVLARSGDSPTAAAAVASRTWAWDCTLDSQFASNGAADHLVTYRLQCAGRRQACLSFGAPQSKKSIHGVSINDRPVAASFSDADSPNAESVKLIVDLPPGEEMVMLAVRFSTSASPLQSFHRLQESIPQIDLPVLTRRWHLRLPPGYVVCSSTGISQGPPIDPPCVMQNLFGPLGRRSGQAMFNPLRSEDWRSSIRLWNTGSPTDAAQEVGPSGESEYCFDLLDTEASVTAVHQATMEGIGWLLFLLLVSFGFLRMVPRPAVLLGIAAVAGIAAIVVPPVLAGIFSRLFLATLFCVALVVLRKWAAIVPTRPPHGELPSTRTNVPMFGIPLKRCPSDVPFGAPLLAGVLFWGGSWSDAAEKDRPAPAAASPTKVAAASYSVFIPVDEKQKPTKGKYFVPGAFFDELYRAASREADKPQGWLIASAVYRGALSEDAIARQYAVDRLTADLSIRTFNAPTQVRIPFRRDEGKLLPGEATLDGRLVQPEWEPDGSALLVDIAEAGEHRLEISLRPNLLHGDRSTVEKVNGTGFDLSIPRLPGSRLEFAVPAALPAVTFPAASGEVRWEEIESRWNAELGSGDKLSVRWQDPQPSNSGSPVAEIEQLLWMKVLPQAVLLDVRLKVKVSEGQLRRLRLLADPSLSLLPSEPADGVSIQSSRGNGPTDAIEIQWLRSVVDSATVDLHFLCSDAASVGTLRLPKLELANGRLLRRSVAVSIDSSLDYRLPSARNQDSLSVPDFLARWGTSNAAPQVAAQLSDDEAEFGLSTHPKLAETVGDQNQTLIFDADSCRLRVDAQFETSGGSVFQYQLMAPTPLRIESISITSDGVERMARWSQDRTGRITVFLSAPVTGRQAFHFRGIQSLPKKRVVPLPFVKFDDVRMQNALVYIYRQSGALVDIAGTAGLAEVKPAQDDSGRNETGRLVQSFYVDPNKASQVTIGVKPNRTQTKAEQISRLSWEGDRWQAVVDCRMHVSNGLVDVIELDAPAYWTGPFTTSPPMVVSASHVSDQRTRLLLRPTIAISGDFAFTVTSPLNGTARKVAVADISMRQIASLKKYLVLPAKVDNRPIFWTTQNLRHVDLPNLFSGAESTMLEVTGEPWQATLQESRHSGNSTRVSAADLRIVWQGDGRTLGLAIFDVETAQTFDCPTELPKGAELLQLSVAGVPVDPVSAGPCKWLVPLSGDRPNARVEMLYYAPNAANPARDGWAQHRRFDAPRLGDLPVERTLWTIAGPPNFEAGAARDDAFQIGQPDKKDATSNGELCSQWQRMADAGPPGSTYTVQGPSDSITLYYRPIAARAWYADFTKIAGFLALIALAALVSQSNVAWNSFIQWPYLFGIALGLGWWLWLSPSIAGLAIMVATLLCRFWPWNRFPESPLGHPNQPTPQA